MDEARELDERARRLEEEAIRWGQLSVIRISASQYIFYRLDRADH